ncbi:class I SAM-dependent methyltransferase family protein [Nanoarchaeota archaeon]
MDKSLKESLKKKLTKKELEILPSSYDVVGDILIFADFPKELKKKEKVIAEKLLEMHKNVNVVCKKIGKYSGTYRTPKLKIIAGEKRKETTHKENNVRMSLNVENCYFSPRSSNERKRISEQVKNKESVLIMFSGVAPYPLVIAKNASPKEVYAIEINPRAHKYAEFNIKKNKLDDKIKLFKGDVRKTIPKLNKKFDRIAMPLPRSAGKFLDLAIKSVKKKGIIHFYDFLHEDQFDEAMAKIDAACKKTKKKYKILKLVKCGQFGPGIFRICIDFRIN